MAKFAGSLTIYPARALFYWYVLLTLGGGAILSLPISSAPGRECSFVDAVFTATSAACVTGLTVRSTGNDFSTFGQVVILLLIQLGGVGIITLTTFISVYLLGSENLRQRASISETLGMKQNDRLSGVIRAVLVVTLTFEGIGAGVLFVRFLFDLPPGQAAWHAVFHSVSAFCNAGFGLRDDNMVRYRDDFTVNLVIMSLIVVGGIGFPVIIDLLRARRSPRGQRWERLQLHTKLMLIGSVAMILGGALLYVMLEQGRTLKPLNWYQSLLVAFFQMVNTRTAGFNTTDILALSNATLFLMVLWMFVGAGPCSTAGGFKVSALMTLVCHALATFRGRSRTVAFRRTITQENISRATTAVLLYALAGTIGTAGILLSEDGHDHGGRFNFRFIDGLFEVVSALGTVGLSTGLTPHLTVAGKIVITLLMFVGRVGPVGVVIALSRPPREEKLTRTAEDVIIG
jgi:trk system potassium uptake protein TrkH